MEYAVPCTGKTAFWAENHYLKVLVVLTKTHYVEHSVALITNQNSVSIRNSKPYGRTVDLLKLPNKTIRYKYPYVIYYYVLSRFQKNTKF